jgi:hypothetical protein
MEGIVYGFSILRREKRSNLLRTLQQTISPGIRILYGTPMAKKSLSLERLGAQAA